MPDKQPADMQKKLKAKRRRELVAYFADFVKEQGLGAAVSRTAHYVKRRYGMKKGRFLPKKAELARQRAADTTGWPQISVVVPVYKPDAGFFAALLQSVQAQTYPGWQLCLADGSPDKAPVRDMVEKLGDSRIVLTGVENTGMAGNTNAAAALATGEYIAFCDHDDLLAPHALYHMAQKAHETGASLLYSDEALFARDMQKPSVGHFKPDFSLQYLLNVNYICHLVVVKRSLFDELGGLRGEFDGSQDHDFLLRAVEKTGGAVHIPRVLYYWRQHTASTSLGTGAKPYVAQAAKKAVEEHLQRTGRPGRVLDGRFPSTYRVEYELLGEPRVSIIIPTSDHVEDLDRCLQSVYNKTSYRNFEVVLVENNSKKEETFRYYEKAEAGYDSLRVVHWQGKGFNFAALCNYGAIKAHGGYYLFLNNDTEVITPEWLSEMLGLCQLPEVGAAGAMLYYPDDTIQHAGVIVGLGGFAGHSHKYLARGKSGYMFRAATVQELSAVTGACLMVKRSMFERVDGFDEAFTVAYNDVDLCLRINAAGYSVVFTPYAELYHYESKSRGSDEKGPARERFAGEQALLQQRYGTRLLQDPYYNPNLTYDREDFSENDVLPEG